jgi:hypothetical protein
MGKLGVAKEYWSSLDVKNLVNAKGIEQLTGYFAINGLFRHQ